MTDYSLWLNECRGGDYAVKVKFKNAPRDVLIKDGMVAFEDVLNLCARLPETGWRMTFDDYPSQIIKLEIDAIGRRVILRETLIYSPAAYMHMGEFGLYRA